MKKYFILILCLCIFTTGCGKEEKELTPEEKAQIEFEQDLKTAGISQVVVYDEERNPGTYNCEELKDDIVHYDNNIFITKDNKIYAISSSLYTNNTNCKQLLPELKFKQAVGSEYYTVDNEAYTYSSSNSTLSESTYTYNQEFYEFLFNYYKDNTNWNIYTGTNIEGIDRTLNQSTNKNSIYTYVTFAGTTYALRNGNIYVDAFKKTTVNNYKTGKKSTKYELVNSVLIYSKSDFDGEVIAITKSGSIANDKNQLPIVVKTTNGYYMLAKTNAEQCDKYQDVECIYEMKNSEFLSKYYTQFKYVGNNFLIDNDGIVYRLPYNY